MAARFRLCWPSAPPPERHSLRSRALTACRWRQLNRVWSSGNLWLCVIQPKRDFASRPGGWSRLRPAGCCRLAQAGVDGAPIDPRQRDEFDGFRASPRATAVDDLGLVETVDRLCQSIVPRLRGAGSTVSNAADGWLDAGLAKAFGVLHRRIVRPAVRVMDERAAYRRRSCTACSKASRTKPAWADRLTRQPVPDSIRNLPGESIDDERLCGRSHSKWRLGARPRGHRGEVRHVKLLGAGARNWRRARSSRDSAALWLRQLSFS